VLGEIQIGGEGLQRDFLVVIVFNEVNCPADDIIGVIQPVAPDCPDHKGDDVPEKMDDMVDSGDGHNPGVVVDIIAGFLQV